MKKLVLHLLAFSLFMSVFLFLVIGLTGRYAPDGFKKNIKNKREKIGGHMFSRMKDLDSIPSVDILIIGSSHAYRGFDPRIFARRGGYKMFNLGSSAQTPMQTEVLVKQHIKRLKPRLVIFEVFPGVFSIDGVESTADLLNNCSIGLNTILLSFRINNIIIYNTLMASVFRNLFFKDHYKEPACKNGECYIPGGFVQRTELEVFKGEANTKSLQWNFRNDQIRAFHRTISFLKKNNYPTMLVQAPVHRSMIDAYQNNVEIDNFYHSFGLTYYNMNLSKIGCSNDNFYDRDHLNIHGVRQFNRMILRLLKDNHGWIKEPTGH